MYTSYNGYYNPMNANYMFRQQIPMSSQLNGRIVTSIEEVKASQISLDGSISYFPSPAENKIYTKFVGMDGLPVILCYEAPKGVSQSQPSFSDNNEISEIKERINKLECIVKEMKNNDESNGTNAINESNATESKPNANASKYSW